MIIQNVARYINRLKLSIQDHMPYHNEFIMVDAHTVAMKIEMQLAMFKRAFSSTRGRTHQV